MAAEALTYVAQRTGSGLSAVMQSDEEIQNWQVLLKNNDAEEMWRRISALVSTAFSGSENVDQKTQDVFLHLLSAGRFSLYIDQRLSDEEICLDVLSIATN